ncbi:MAG: NAD(P)H-dependent oxidoreductase subunit E [Bacillota bacterium]|nr:NAD(P)H-dependent oxidoreductase subunit E [Bacillota bacterium]
MQFKKVLGLEVPCGPGGMTTVSLLQTIQEEYGYLPEEVLQKAAEETGFSLTDLYSIATFYKSFSLVPRGRHRIVACTGTACHVRGSDSVIEEISRVLNVKKNSTSEDGEYSLECVNCMGACALGPLVVVDGCHHGRMTPAGVRLLFTEDKEKEEAKAGTAGLEK